MSNGKAVENSKKEGAPRLCHVIKTPSFDGYGFNLHAEKGKPGQYIGKVDEGSPAEHAGLVKGDRILEVNGVDITSETHKQVVQRIKSIPNETKLLVVSPLGVDDASSKSSTETAITAPASDSTNNSAPDTPKVNSHENHTNDNENNITQKLKMTAAELRAHLATRKKYDPKKDSLDVRKKFDIVQKL